MAFSRATGELVWETARPFLRSGWSTPAIWSHEDGDELVVLGHGRVVGYNPLPGKKSGSRAFLAKPSPFPCRVRQVYVLPPSLASLRCEIDPSHSGPCYSSTKTRTARLDVMKSPRTTWPCAPSYRSATSEIFPRTRRAAAIVNKVSSGGRTRTGTTCGQRRSYHPISRIAPENRF